MVSDITKARLEKASGLVTALLGKAAARQDSDRRAPLLQTDETREQLRSLGYIEQ